MVDWCREFDFYNATVNDGYTMAESLNVRLGFLWPAILNKADSNFDKCSIKPKQGDGS